MPERSERMSVASEAPKEVKGYERYQELGGRINQEGYERILLRAGGAPAPSTVSIAQAKGIANFAGIVLDNETSGVDKRVALYGIMRNDSVPTDPENSPLYKNHYTRMSDQQLFAEVLRMVGDNDSLQKLISSHPHTSF